MYNNKTFKYNILIFPVMLVIVAILFIVSSVIVHAEESIVYNYHYYVWRNEEDTYGYKIEYIIDSVDRVAMYLPLDTNPDSVQCDLYYLKSDGTADIYTASKCHPSINVYKKTTYNDGKISEGYLSGNYGCGFRTSMPYNNNVPIFTDKISLKNYLADGDDSGQINKPIDMSTATYNSKIPVPKLVFNSKGGYKFSIANAVDSYYIQIKGRWYTVDDITLFKENLQWKYKYDTLIKGALTEWVKPNDKILATADHDLCDYNRNGYGGEAFTALLTQYVIEQRNYSGGTNALGNKISGYTDALSSLKELHLNNPESAFNSPEIYIRFIVVNEDKSISYGKWCHWYSNLANAAGSSGFNLDDSENVSGESQSYNGLTDDEFNTNEQQENPRNDSDIYTYVNSDYIKQNIEISSDIANKTGAFFDLLNSMSNAMGQFPQMFKDVFMFLPPWFINFIVIAMGAIIIARFIGR